MTPKFTVGIAFKNPGDFFLPALQSVFAQDMEDWELILMDDGSTDGSLALARQLSDSRVRVFSDGENRNLNVRLNQMISLAHTPFFARMDADDIMHPHRLKAQWEALTRHDTDTVVGSAAFSIDGTNRVVGFRPACSCQTAGFSARHSFHHPTVAAPTRWFRQHRYSEKWVYSRAEDAELWCRTTHTTRFCNISEPLLFYREVNTFSLGNYIGTTCGLLTLLTERFSRPRPRFLYLFFKELAKVGIAAACSSFGFEEWLVSRRFQDPDPGILKNATCVLGQVLQTPLPLKPT